MDERDDERNTPSLAGAGDVHAVQAWVERLLGRSLSDVRVHDSSQAGDLARRLGARAFTVGRHVYARPELLRAPAPQAAALLAHELTHTVEQAGTPAAPPPASGLAPLLTV